MNTKISSTANLPILLLTDSVFAQQVSLDLQTVGYLPILDKVQKGWRKLSCHQPVMVIVDRAFTGKSGVNLCHQLRSAGDRIPVLMLVEQETV